MHHLVVIWKRKMVRHESDVQRIEKCVIHVIRNWHKEVSSTNLSDSVIIQLSALCCPIPGENYSVAFSNKKHWPKPGLDVGLWFHFSNLLELELFEHSVLLVFFCWGVIQIVFRANASLNRKTPAQEVKIVQSTTTLSKDYLHPADPNTKPKNSSNPGI